MNKPIEDTYPFLRVIHPTHFRYLKDAPLCTLNEFFQVLESLNPEMRHKITQISGYFILIIEKPKEELLELINDPEALYIDFELQCRKTAKVFNELLIVLGIVQYTLTELFRLGDTTCVDEAKDRIIGLIESSKNKVVEYTEATENSISKLVEHVTYLPEKTEQYYELYIYFCENVLQKLF